MQRQTISDLRKTLDLSSEIAIAMESLTALNPTAAKALVAELAAIAGLNNGTPDRRSPASPSGGGPMDKVSAALLARGNTPMTKAEIITATGLTGGSLHQLIYGSAPDKFNKAQNPGGRGKVFSLTKEAIEEARKSTG